MVSRAFSQHSLTKVISDALKEAWSVAADANALEGEIASQTRKLEALERRGRALRAEIGRKVEELAEEESKALRESSTYSDQEADAQQELSEAQQIADTNIRAADLIEPGHTEARGVYEKAGAAGATLTMKATALQTCKKNRELKETIARDLHRQIDELRAQLSRYAEAVEEDLNSGRKKVAEKSRLGLEYEKRFQEASEVLIANLRARPEVRDLLVEIGEAQPLLSVKKANAAE